MSGHDGDHARVPQPQGTYAGLPYDWRRPSLARARARLWNPGDPRVFPPSRSAGGWPSTSTGWRTRCAWSAPAAPADAGAGQAEARSG
jgi:hypothetical protein